MNLEQKKELVQKWYESLVTNNVELFQSVHAPDCIYNISGHSPISGQVAMPDLMEHVLPLVLGSLRLDEYRFCTRQAIVCADENRIVGIMEADGPGVNGVRYDQRYVHMFECDNGKITQVWEFFDTALANSVMFPDPRQKVPGVVRDKFEIPG